MTPFQEFVSSHQSLFDARVNAELYVRTTGMRAYIVDLSDGLVETVRPFPWGRQEMPEKVNWQREGF